MKESNFIEALYDALHSKSGNKEKTMKQWGGKLTKINLKNTQSYANIENALGVSMDVYHKNKLIHKTTKPVAKHASLVLDKDVFKPVGFMNGGTDKSDIVRLFSDSKQNIVQLSQDYGNNLYDHIIKHIKLPSFDQNTLMSDLGRKSHAQLLVALKSFVPTIPEINYINAVLVENELQIEALFDVPNLSIERVLTHRHLMGGMPQRRRAPSPSSSSGSEANGSEASDRSSGSTVQEDDGDEEISSGPPETIQPYNTYSNPSDSIMKRITNTKLNITVLQFLKLMAMFCILGAFILNPIFKYMGFWKLVQVSQVNYEFPVDLPIFYTNQNHDQEKIIFTGDLIEFPRYELSPYAKSFQDILKNPTYMITNVLPSITFTDQDITQRFNSEQEFKSEMTNKVAILEKMYNVMKSNQPVGPFYLEKHETKLLTYFNRIFGFKDITKINKEVFRYMDTALSSMYEDKKQEVLRYNREVVSKYKGELVKIVVEHKYNKISDSKLIEHIQKTAMSFENDFKAPKALEAVRNIRYCLSREGPKSVVDCVQTDVLSERDLLYSKTYFEFIEFFNKMGLMYNQIYDSSKNMNDKVKDMIVKDVPEAYHNNIEIGVVALKNEFLNIITEAIYNSKFTESEAATMNNLKIIGGMNIFDIFLQMYSDTLKDTLGGSTIKNVVNKIVGFINDKTITNFRNASERIIDSIQNDIRMKEKLFLHTNYDTDVLIDFMKNLDPKTSLTTQAIRSVSKTNIDLFVEIKVKNIVLQILSMLRNTQSIESTKVLTNSLTDLFYIIPYYSYKHRYSIEFSGGGKKSSKVRGLKSSRKESSYRKASSSRKASK
jgi:hypothetical protein